MSKPKTTIRFVSIASGTDLPEGGRLNIELDGYPILIFRQQGNLFAIGSLCTHEHESIAEGELDGNEIICPFHGARFDYQSGKASALPAVKGIPIYPLREVNGQIEIGLQNNSTRISNHL